MTTQAVYERRGTPLVFCDSGGDKLLALNALAAATGRLSAFYDRGAGAAPGEYEVRAYCGWVSNPTVGDALNVGVVESDGTHTDAGLTYNANSDAALALVALNALPSIAGSVIAHTADTAEKGTVAIVRISSRYFAIGTYNTSSGNTLTASANASGVIVTPLYPDVQAAA